MGRGKVDNAKDIPRWRQKLHTMYITFLCATAHECACCLEFPVAITKASGSLQFKRQQKSHLK